MDMKNLKVGDKVRVISEEEVRKHIKKYGYTFSDGIIFSNYMFKYCDKIVTIASLKSTGYLIKEDNGTWFYTYDMFEQISLSTHKMVILADTNDKKYRSGNYFYSKKEGFTNLYEKDWDISIPINLLSCFIHRDGWKEVPSIKMTQSEIESKLGYKIEIVSEDEK